MLGALLIWFSGFFEEVSATVGKSQMKAKTEDVAVYGFLQAMAMWIAFMVMLTFLPNSMQFSWSSLPTLGVRVFFEVLLAYLAILALDAADRSTMGVLRSGTIPLLLGVDLLLGYSLSTLQIVGILFLFGLILLAVQENVIRKKGLKLVAMITVIPVITSSLYKYDITHFNSVAVEQVVVFSAQLIFWTWLNRRHHTNPFLGLRDPKIVAQTISISIASVLVTVAFVYSFPSLVIAIKRASTVFWSILSGVYVFRESKALAKFSMAGAMLAVMVFMF